MPIKQNSTKSQNETSEGITDEFGRVCIYFHLEWSPPIDDESHQYPEMNHINIEMRPKIPFIQRISGIFTLTHNQGNRKRNDIKYLSIFKNEQTTCERNQQRNKSNSMRSLNAPK